MTLFYLILQYPPHGIDSWVSSTQLNRTLENRLRGLLGNFGRRPNKSGQILEDFRPKPARAPNTVRTYSGVLAKLYVTTTQRGEGGLGST